MFRPREQLFQQRRAVDRVSTFRVLVLGRLPHGLQLHAGQPRMEKLHIQAGDGFPVI